MVVNEGGEGLLSFEVGKEVSEHDHTSDEESVGLVVLSRASAMKSCVWGVLMVSEGRS